MSKAGEIRRDEYCFDYTGSGAPVIYECHGLKGNQLWEYYHEVNQCQLLELLFSSSKEIETIKKWRLNSDGGLLYETALTIK